MKNGIRCPHCNAEYAPSEIYMPNSFLGKVRDIEKDLTGSILYQERGEMDLSEKYVCDYCKRPFIVSAKVSFTTKPDDISDFSKPYATKRVKPSLFMKED